MRIKRITLTLAFLVTFLNCVIAQELTIKSLTGTPMDLSASQYERKDLAGQPCGLVKVQLATMGAKFEGNIVGQTEYKTGEYWVYMTEGAYMLTVKLSGTLPLDINFRDYGISGVTGKSTYKLTLLMPQIVVPVKEQKLIVNYTPADAMVLIDSKPYKGNGRVETSLTLGSHSYIIAAEGYETAEGSVKLNGGSPRTITEDLVAMARIQPVQQQTEAPTPQQKLQTIKPAQQSATFNNALMKDSIETFTVNGVSFNMVRVDGGTFTMGATSEQGSDASDDEKPAHEVTLATYSIGETEVTQELWQAVMGSNPSRFKGSNQPVEKVSWYDSQTFIQKLNQLTGRHFRLPTEAEWEYAARGGSKSRGYKYSGSNNINEVAWYSKTTDDKGSRNVKTKKANELGLYDMSGNVYEWCQGVKDNYISNPEPNPSGPTSGYHRVCRGGSWGHLAGYCRVSDRSMDVSVSQSPFIGLRLAL